LENFISKKIKDYTTNTYLFYIRKIYNFIQTIWRLNKVEL